MSEWFSDFLLCFWVVILSAGGGFMLGEWIWKRFIRPCNHWPVIRVDGSVDCEKCHKALRKWR